MFTLKKLSCMYVRQNIYFIFLRYYYSEIYVISTWSTNSNEALISLQLISHKICIMRDIWLCIIVHQYNTSINSHNNQFIAILSSFPIHLVSPRCIDSPWDISILFINRIVSQSVDHSFSDILVITSPVVGTLCPRTRHTPVALSVPQIYPAMI